MYCKNCHTLMPEGEIICENCGYDNSMNEDILEETKEIDLNPRAFKQTENKKKITKVIAVLLIIIIIFSAAFYIINDSKSIEKSKQEKQETSSEVLDKTFNLNGLKLTYPSSLFGASKSTIFYKNNNAYNIEIKEITLSDYNSMKDGGFNNTATLGSITTFTKDSDEKIEHIIENNEKYYIITVNYLMNDTLENTKAQLEMTRIINSISFEE